MLAHIQTEKSWYIIQNIMGFVWMFMLRYFDYVKNTGCAEGILTANLFVGHLQDSIDKTRQNCGMEKRYMLITFFGILEQYQ